MITVVMKLTARQVFKRGFTLIELLVVIAVIGVLAAIVLLAVNPGEQLARARDTSRISGITQVGRALQAYYTVQNPAAYPATGTTWMTTMVTSQDLKVAPTNPAYGGALTGCNSLATLGQNGYCYNTGAAETLVYAKLESTLYNSKCSGATPQPYWVFSVDNSRSCGECGAAATDPGVAGAVVCDF